ncbi:FeoB-associated Cys-rich membrane protein [Bacillus sp. XF8]|uniref:FeoB-associated Cys-rich membrane protein n=1 Tax=Bacillus bingmayongensis TaxID=1150157 RepID=A0ABU5JRE7_9BACI|nr:FeoB-associated Cys-rich membrane protein [Bacillus sp. XF8]MBO1582372.1 FeoB-associated Cys-rich membrane protein [Bacillus sp. XF8]MDZ5605697.1 FeoB-associated Cys-rich membrane protein [Bacillus pseudomycoides]
MMVNIVIGAIIFGYAGYTLFNFVKRSKKGKCAACSLNKSCQSNSCSLDREHVVNK